MFYAIPPGESSKTRRTKEDIEDWMLDRGCDRNTVIVAFGGGVVGDLSGYVAATFMRGIRYVHVPTTLLAMVDSSIGGKTGVDTPAGKNLVGAFYRPTRVYTDPRLLATLPAREFANGMAEIIKAGAIYDANLFELLERCSEEVSRKKAHARAFTCIIVFVHTGLGPTPSLCSQLNNQHAELLEHVVHASIAIKVAVVLEDEKEAGLREILNFGHSVGHAIEAIKAPELLHGECVSIGMIKETEVARARGDLSPDALNRLIACLQVSCLASFCLSSSLSPTFASGSPSNL